MLTITHSNVKEFVIKVRPITTTVFFCLDSKTLDTDIKIIETDANNYKSQTDCSGNAI